MKKTLSLLFVTLLLCLPAAVFADENTSEVTGENASVTLYANIASQYTVKLPARVDVTNQSTDFDIFAKGSITADKQLDVTISAGQHSLADTITGSSRSYPLNVSVADGTFDADDLTENYQNNLKAVVTVEHAALMAGNYSYNLPIVISLNSNS